MKYKPKEISKKWRTKEKMRKRNRKWKIIMKFTEDSILQEEESKDEWK